MRSRSPADAGTVTAEFAVVLPAVLLVLALCAGAVNLTAQQVSLASLASSGARMLARGDDVAMARDRIGAAAPGAQLAQSSDGAFTCVTLRRTARIGPVGLGAVELSARGCALAGDPVPGGAQP